MALARAALRRTMLIAFSAVRERRRRLWPFVFGDA